MTRNGTPTLGDGADFVAGIFQNLMRYETSEIAIAVWAAIKARKLLLLGA